jgi:uncharacterized membrane protein YjgN (DUF898 family)
MKAVDQKFELELYGTHCLKTLELFFELVHDFVFFVVFVVFVVVAAVEDADGVVDPEAVDGELAVVLVEKGVLGYVVLVAAVHLAAAVADEDVVGVVLCDLKGRI